MTPSPAERAAFVHAFREKFGDRAVAVAQARLAATEPGDARESWQAIVDALTDTVIDFSSKTAISLPKMP